MPERPLLTIVVPVLNEAASVAGFLAALEPVCARVAAEHGVDCELLFVDDGSTDGTGAALLATPCAIPLGLVTLSRNFGKEAAMTAGLAEAAGDAVVVMDVDLQDPPDLVVEMVARWRAGAPVVLARRSDRTSDTFLKAQSANWFYRLHNRISQVQIPPNVGDFRLMDRQVVEAVNALPENRRFMKGIFAWVGFPPEVIDYVRPVRAEGRSKFTGWKLWRFAVEGITSFSEVPLVVWTYVGFTISLTAFVYAGFIVVRTLAFGADVPGYASLLTGVLFLGGIQILGIGVLGEYIGRIYSEVKRRPPYIVARRDPPGPRRPGTARAQAARDAAE